MSPFGRPSFGALRHLRRRFGARVDRFKRRGARSVRRELVADPQVALAVAAHAAATGESEERAWARVREYAAEIVPSFSLVAYYRLGYLVSRALIPLFYRTPEQELTSGDLGRILWHGGTSTELGDYRPNTSPYSRQSASRAARRGLVRRLWIW